jgi:hypothetical protein
MSTIHSQLQPLNERFKYKGIKKALRNNPDDLGQEILNHFSNIELSNTNHCYIEYLTFDPRSPRIRLV